MPRKQRPPFEVAVTASPLFKLALEVRILIYELLLIQEGGMFISRDIFARREYGRTGSTPYQCSLCGHVLLNHHGSKQRMAKHYPDARSEGVYPLRTLLPGVSVSLLQTCRIIRLEASPILYSKNSFHLADPVTASNFRWSTDCAQAKATQDIGIKIGSFQRLRPWVTYLTKRTLSLGQDFPHLRRMTIDLHIWCELEFADLLRSMSEGFGQRCQRLDWVLILMFDDEKVLDCFKPLVDRGNDSENREKEVRRYSWQSGRTWKSALLWWGSLGEAVPQKYRSIARHSQPSQPTDEGSSTL